MTLTIPSHSHMEKPGFKQVSIRVFRLKFCTLFVSAMCATCPPILFVSFVLKTLVYIFHVKNV